MNEPIPTACPSLSPRAGFIFFSFYLLSLALCFFVPRALTFLPASVSLCGIFYMLVKQRVLPCIDKKFLLFFGGFGALMALSSLWSPDASYTFCKSLKNCGVLLAGLLPLVMANGLSFNTSHKNALVMASSLFCIFAGAFLFVEYSTEFYITRLVMGITETYRELWPQPIKSGFLYNRSSVLLVLLSFPALLMLRTSALPKLRKDILTILMAVSVAIALYASGSQTALIAALFAVPVLFLPWHRKNARRVMMAALFVTMLLAPLIPIPANKLLLETHPSTDKASFMERASVPHRLEVWKFMAEQIAQSPIIGHGVESTRSLRAGYKMPNMGTDQVMHPHNAVLQIWVELGVVGILFVMAFCHFILRKLDSIPRVMQRYHTIFFIIMLSVLSMGYGLWQSWLIGMIFSLVALAQMAARITGVDGCANKSGDPV